MSPRLLPCAGVGLALAFALAGCTVGPDFERLAVKSPAAFGPEPATPNAVTYGGQVESSWWRSFNDAELDALVGRLAVQNLDLQVAAERVEEARAQTRVAASQGLPQVSANGSYQRIRVSPTGFLSLVEPSPTAQLEVNNFQEALGASWELDLFGRVRRTVEAQRANVTAAAEARHGLALMALADLAQDYTELRTLQARAAIARASVATADHNLSLERDRFDHGVGTTIDVAQATAQRDAIAAQLPTLATQQGRLINAIGLLLAEPPRALWEELTPSKAVPVPPPSAPIGVPGELVRRRPDVREAEARLHAVTAEVGAAKADFYPDVILNGSAGLESLQASQNFDWASRQFFVGPSVILPIFSGGRLRATLKLREAAQREAAIVFRKTVLQSWEEVDDALTAYADIQKRRAENTAAVAQDRVALDAAQQRYARGATSFLKVLAAQVSLLQDQDHLAADYGAVDIDLIQLYRALGGGWEVADPTSGLRSGRGRRSGP